MFDAASHLGTLIIKHYLSINSYPGSHTWHSKVVLFIIPAKQWPYFTAIQLVSDAVPIVSVIGSYFQVHPEHLFKASPVLLVQVAMATQSVTLYV